MRVWSRSSAIVFAAVVGCLLAGPPSAQAAAPANDDFANAELVGPAIPAAAGGTTAEATAESGEPSHTGLGGAQHSVWYQWTPASPVEATLQTCSEEFSFGPAIAAYTGSAVDALTPVANSAGTCRMHFSAAAGTTYKIAVDDFGGSEFVLRLRQNIPPANDNFANAELIGPGLPITQPGTKLDATSETGEPAHGPFGSAAASVWYRWTPSANVVARIDACDDSGFGATFAVYTGTQVDSLTPVAQAEPNTCRAHFSATAGTEYKIAVDGDQGPFTLSVRQFSPPANDDFANAQPIGPGVPASQPGTNVDATSETGEPDHSGFGAGAVSSVWYSWTPSANRLARIDVCDDDSFHSVAVYTGTQVDALTPVAVGDCDVHFQATAGVDYRIAVDNVFEEGAFTLELRALVPPANDNFADAVTIGPGIPLTEPGTNVDATSEPGEPSPLGMFGPDARSVWYRWTPGANVTVVMDICGSPLTEEGSGVINVYTGAAVNALSPVASSNNFGPECRLRFDAAAGTTYMIAVDGAGNEGDFDLAVRQLNSPPNDDFANAVTIGPGLPVNQPGTNLDATRETGEPNPFTDPNPTPLRGSVWYQWTPTVNVEATVDACDLESFHALAIYTGNAVNALTRVPGTTGNCPQHFAAVAGTTYRIVVDGPESDFTLRVHPFAPPANDHFADATVIGPGLPISQPGTTIDASRDPHEPNPIPGFPATASVWYRWTPSTNHQVTIETCASDFDTVLGVFTGSSLVDLHREASNDDGCPGADATGSKLLFYVVGGTQYSIVVDGFDAGAFTLGLTDIPMAPAAPVLSGSSPSSPANNNDPKIIGSAAAGTSVTLYTNASCTSAVAGSGSDAQLASPGIAAHVGDNTSTTFYATATAGPWTSPCSATSVTYVEQTPSTGGPPPPPPQPEPGPTGKRAAALKKCKKRKGIARKRCVKKANKKPV
jgi:hypothetical protein